MAKRSVSPTTSSTFRGTVGFEMISISSTVPTGPEGIMNPSNRRRPRGGFAKVTSVSTGVEEMAISWAISRSLPGFFASLTATFDPDLTIDDRRATISPTSILASSAGREERRESREGAEPKPEPGLGSMPPLPSAGTRGPADTRG